MNTQTLADLCRLPDTTAGNSARRLVWSLWNQHYAVNLWDHVGNLPADARQDLARIITGSVEEREAQLRALLTEAGEFNRIDTHPLETKCQPTRGADHE